jgi:molybdate transport system regulatory protein
MATRGIDVAKLSVRIAFDVAGQIGPGKIDLLEAIDACGSITHAGRRMAMSYRRAWEMVDELNGLFRTPLVMRHAGGKNGGGTSLTALGQELVTRYRSIEHAAAEIARIDLEILESALRSRDASAPIN